MFLPFFIAGWVVLILLTYIFSFESTYLKNKTDLLRIYTSLVSDMRIDTKDKAIHPKNIEDIKNSILYFSKRIIKLQKTFLMLKKVKKDDSFIEQERNFIITVSTDFKKLLQTWLEYHKEELQFLSNELNTIKKDIKGNDFLGNVELHQKIIESQMIRI